MRYFIELAYNGNRYHGWQYQPDAATVQESLEKSLSAITQETIPVVGAGRTDTGVHATQYFAHFDAEEISDKKELIYKLNSILPSDIAVYDILKVAPEAHARFDAESRSYKYYVIQQKDPFLNERSHFIKNELDIEIMNRCAESLKNYEDFKCFSKSRTDVRTYNCRIIQSYWEKQDRLLVFHITADRFLRNMVRAIVGTLLEIGVKKLPEEALQEIIKSRDRQKAGTSVPAKALFLTGIKYPESIFI